METKGLVRDEFNTLRNEIKATRARLFWIMGMGVFGIPILTYAASHVGDSVMLLVPFSVLVLIVGYLDEWSNMIRAARYIRESLESNPDLALGWETWLESRGELRSMEKHYTACFIVILFVYYFMIVGTTMNQLFGDARYDPSGTTTYWIFGVGLIYLIGAIWAVSTLLRHWKTALTTTANIK